MGIISTKAPKRSISHPCKRIMAVSVFLGLVCSAQVCLAAIQLRGSTTLLPVTQILAENYMSENKSARVVVAGGGTERGYKSLYDNTADIAMASSEPSADTLSQMSLHQRSIDKYLIGYAPIYIAVSPQNKLDSISSKDLSDIFTGRTTQWNHLGGVNAAIDVLVGPPTGGVNASWKELILKNIDTYTPQAKVLSNEERYAYIQTHPNAIAFLVGDPKDFTNVRLLKVDTAEATDENIKTGKYWLRAPLFYVTNANPGDEVLAFIQYAQNFVVQQSWRGIVAPSRVAPSRVAPSAASSTAAKLKEVK